MAEQDVLAALGEIVQEATGIPAVRVTPDASFVDDLDVDSLSMVEIATMAEDRFGVAIPDDKLSKLKTVGDVVTYVNQANVPA
ncbi:MAG TPA: acyl carrier protein [Mycobacteriales bacterium]|nr:acyl carrier protein [Mycobacteriales bacterium]